MVVFTYICFLLVIVATASSSALLGLSGSSLEVDPTLSSTQLLPGPKSKLCEQISNSPSSQQSIFPGTRPLSAANPTSCQFNDVFNFPSAKPSIIPTKEPTSTPTKRPSRVPSSQPSEHPSYAPSSQPSNVPTTQPTVIPTLQPSSAPTAQPSVIPIKRPSRVPSSQPSEQPSYAPSSQPSNVPTFQPTVIPTLQPSSAPTAQPSGAPTIRRVARICSNEATSFGNALHLVIGLWIGVVLSLGFVAGLESYDLKISISTCISDVFNWILPSLASLRNVLHLVVLIQAVFSVSQCCTCSYIKCFACAACTVWVLCACVVVFPVALVLAVFFFDERVEWMPLHRSSVVSAFNLNEEADDSDRVLHLQNINYHLIDANGGRRMQVCNDSVTVDSLHKENVTCHIVNLINPTIVQSSEQTPLEEECDDFVIRCESPLGYLDSKWYSNDISGLVLQYNENPSESVALDLLNELIRLCDVLKWEVVSLVPDFFAAVDAIAACQYSSVINAREPVTAFCKMRYSSFLPQD